jgi:hypothetical protein
LELQYREKKSGPQAVSSVERVPTIEDFTGVKIKIKCMYFPLKLRVSH